MSYWSLVERVRSGNHLFSALIELTYRCNLDCAFCYNDLGLRGRPLTRDQYLRLFAELADMGVMDLTLSGGEPLAHADFFALGAAARELGFVVRVKSNGHALRRHLAERLKAEVDPFQLDISLHGATAAVHDRQTRIPGSFERLQGNLTTMRAVGLRLQLRVPVTAWNEHEAEAMCVLADDLGVQIQFDTQITPRDNGDLAPLRLSPSVEGVERLRRRAEARRQSGDDENGPTALRPEAEVESQASPARKHCGAGSSSVTIDPVGNVYPCVQWRRPVGNLHDQGIRDIWTGSPGLAAVRDIAVQVRKVVDGLGEHGKAINFCPGLAEQRTGSAVAVYDNVRINLSVLEKLAAEKARGKRTGSAG